MANNKKKVKALPFKNYIFIILQICLFILNCILFQRCKLVYIEYYRYEITSIDLRLPTYTNSQPKSVKNTATMPSNIGS